MKTTQEVATLIKKYIDGNSTVEEVESLMLWAKEKPENESFLAQLLKSDDIYADAIDYISFKEDTNDEWLAEFEAGIMQRIQNPVKKFKIAHLAWISSAAAAILLTFFSYLYFSSHLSTSVDEPFDLAEVVPGSNKAELILPNGKRIALRDDKEWIAMGESLKYSDGSPVLSEDPEMLAKQLITIEVPRGGRYKIMLPDGSKVWLNSLSKLVHPFRFAADKREVTLTGEAYFEVAQLSVAGKRVPFTVHTDKQSIEVTGTAFNVSAYMDNTATVTTLVHGSVDICTNNQRLSLKPNQQSITTNNGVSKRDVDIEKYIAWKDNKFLFYETPLTEVMREISRWYDIDVSFEGTVNATYLYGEIGMDKNLAEVLRLLEKSGVKFKSAKRDARQRLIVLPE